MADVEGVICVISGLGLVDDNEVGRLLGLHGRADEGGGILVDSRGTTMVMAGGVCWLTWGGGFGDHVKDGEDDRGW